MELTLKHEQVIAFVAAYLDEYGCLPTAPEIAQGCGFRAPRTAARVLDDLEELGVLNRDPEYSRLGRLDLNGLRTDLPPAQQLWLCERTRIEYQFWLEGIRSGLGLAPDLTSVLALHNEGVSRATTLRAFDDACGRLVDGGAGLDGDALVALDEQRLITREALDLIDDWPAFCVVQLVWSLSAHQWLSELQPMQLGYAGSCFAASRRTTESLLPVYWARAAEPLAQHDTATRLVGELSRLLTRLRSGIAVHYPFATEPVVDGASLVERWRQRATS